MDRAVILGTFEFIGFSLCKYLLEQGCEIEGIHIKEGEEEPFLIDMRLEIGRNANFNEKNYCEWLQSQKAIEEETTIFIDFYDLYLKNRISSIRENELIEQYLLKNRNELAAAGSKIVFLFPVQWLKDINRAHSRCETAIELLRKENITVSAFYLPSIYGPWQPREFMFHQAIANHNEAELNSREWIQDAIFIEDVIEVIVKEAEEIPGDSYLLKSSLPGHWQKCAEYLSIEKNKYSEYHRNPSLDKGKIAEKTVKSSMKYADGLEQQRKHLNSILNLAGHKRQKNISN